VLALATAFAGCAWLGPEIIRSGRPAYNDAILTTSDEQLLQNIVRLRFGDSLGLLTVSSVTANVSLTGTAAVNLGFGPQPNYQGNLVPFGGTLTAEQNPTISYTPVSGESLVRQFAAEIPLDLAILIMNFSHSQTGAWMAIVRRVNNLRNPDFPDPPVLVTDPRFEEIGALAGALQRRGSIYWVRLAGAQAGYAVVLHSYSPHNSREVARLLDLLGIAKPVREGDDVVIPVQLSVGSPDPGRDRHRDPVAARAHAARGGEHRAARGRRVGRSALSRARPSWPGYPRPGRERAARAGARGRRASRLVVLHRRRGRDEQAVVPDAAASRRRADAGCRGRHGAGAHGTGDTAITRGVWSERINRKEMTMSKSSWSLLVLSAGVAAGVAYAQHPMLDKVADRVVQKYQTSTCEQLWQERAAGQGKPKPEMEQRLVKLLREDPQLRTEFFNRVSAPIVNKMFECGMIP